MLNTEMSVTNTIYRFSSVVQPAGLGVAYRSENPTDFQLHFDDFDV